MNHEILNTLRKNGLENWWNIEKAFLEKNGIDIVMSADKNIEYPPSPGCMVRGYFIISPKPTIGVAMGDRTDLWLGVLLHEVSHAHQWAEGAREWNEQIAPDGREYIEWIHEWIAGKDYDKATLAVMFDRVRAVEDDCERRVLEVLRQFPDIKLNAERYAQEANGYVLSYHWSQRRRSECDVKFDPTRHPEALAMMPTVMTRDIPEGFLEWLDEKNGFGANAEPEVTAA